MNAFGGFPTGGLDRWQAVAEDRGPQYAAQVYRDVLTVNGLVGSMGRRGNRSPFRVMPIRASSGADRSQLRMESRGEIANCF